MLIVGLKKKQKKKHVCGLLANVCCFSLYFSLSVYGEYFTQNAEKQITQKKKKNTFTHGDVFCPLC